MTDSCMHKFCFTCLQEWSKVTFLDALISLRPIMDIKLLTFSRLSQIASINNVNIANHFNIANHVNIRYFKIFRDINIVNFIVRVL